MKTRRNLLFAGLFVLVVAGAVVISLTDRTTGSGASETAVPETYSTATVATVNGQEPAPVHTSVVAENAVRAEAESESAASPEDTQATEGGSTTTTVGAADPTSTTAAPGSPNRGPSEAPQPSLPDNEIPRTNERDTCRGINERLNAYRELAIAEPLSSLLTLQFGLAEFEDFADLLSDSHDWGLLKVEHLSLVRRDWSTAYTAHQSGDNATATEHFDSAIGHLDDAIEVSCP